MFRKEYRDFMNAVKPEEALVEAVIEMHGELNGASPAETARAAIATSPAKATRTAASPARAAKPMKMLKVAAIVFCALLVLSAGTVVVDAATGGGVQRLLGIKDSVVAGENKTEVVLKEPEGEENYGGSMETEVEDDGTVTVVITTSDDAPVFSCNFELEKYNREYQIGTSLKYCNTKEEIAWKVYQQCKRAFSMGTFNEKMQSAIIGELEKVKKEIGTGDEVKDGCAMGVQFMIDEFRTGYGMLEVVENVVIDRDDVDGDGDCEEVLGLSFLKLDFQEMQLVTERTGQKEFVVDAVAGIPGKYRVTVISYAPSLSYYTKKLD